MNQILPHQRGVEGGYAVRFVGILLPLAESRFDDESTILPITATVDQQATN